MPRFRSKLEERFSDLLKHHRVPFKYEPQKLLYTLECNYTPDFLLPNGIFIETKGHLTPEDRRKMLAVKRQHPDLDIRFVFQNPYNRINPRSQTTYADWAGKHGFMWAHYQQIPKSWLTFSPTTTNNPLSTSTDPTTVMCESNKAGKQLKAAKSK